jgi:hypothetical protein
MSALSRDGVKCSADADRWNRLGVRRALRGEWSTARDCFERAVAGTGEVIEFWINLGVASMHLGDEDTGRGAFELADALARRPRTAGRAPCLENPFAVPSRGVVINE